jgi:FkbM family methyltransferase
VVDNFAGKKNPWIASDWRTAMKWTALKALRKNAGIDIVRARKNPQIIDFLEMEGVDLVIDVGANVGQFGLGLRNRGYAKRILSFEPVSDAYKTLAERVNDDPLWEAKRLAVGSSSGVMTINVSKNTQFSSFQGLTKTAEDFDPDAGFKRTESVSVTTLDELLSPEDLRSKILLKIDTQGYERHVLDGATNMLRHVRGVLVELSIIILYQDNWRLHEAVAYMYERGFVLAQVHPVNIHFKKPYAATEFDCLFRPTESGVD